MSSLLHYQETQALALKKNRFNGIDLVKFLCAFLVFFVHVLPFHGDLSLRQSQANFLAQNYLGRIPVPFFFVCSGFFLFRKMPIDRPDIPTIQNYCFKILRLAGIWYVLLFAGKLGHLWYLGATVIAVILVSLCLYYRMKLRYICLLASIAYGIGLLGDTYYGFIAPLKNIPFFRYLISGYKLVFNTTRNGVFMGFIFVFMGAAFAYRKPTVKPLPALIGFVVSMALMFAETCLLTYHNIPHKHNMHIFALPAVYFLFSFAYTVQLKDRPIYRHLRNIGVLIYFTHYLIYNFVPPVIRFLHNHSGIDLVQYTSLLTLLITVSFAVFVELLSCKAKCKWLTWLFS